MTNYLAPCPADDPATRPTHRSEARFKAFLETKLFYNVSFEPDTFPLPDWGGRPGGFTPDLRIDGQRGWSFYEPVYLELTTADLFLSAADLPQPVRRRNRRRSYSRKAYITPEEYLARKRLKIKTAQAEHPWLRVALLTAADQENYLANPVAMVDLIEALRQPQSAASAV